MCGISGYISHNTLNGSAMVNSLHHRGPDNTGDLSKQVLGKNIFLGHNRLSIIDLSEQGNQPMSTPDGSVTIIFNGEIYNFRKLKEKHFQNKTFRSSTDTEVILYLYEKLGIDFVNQLNGDFAMAIFDEKRAKLYLIKDRLGVKPLYYFQNNETLVFASEIKAIKASGIKIAFAQENLADYFIFKYTPGDETLYKNVKRLPPGSYLEYDLEKNTAKINRYWTLKKNVDYAKLSYNDAQHVLYSLIEDAVRIRLIADVPVGTFLSGGLDSSVIASFLKENSSIKNYCASKSSGDIKREGTTSDFYYASRLAKDWNLNLTGINIGSNEAEMENIKTTLYHSDDLIADGSQIPSYLITKEASKSSKVILSGMGADEFFMGYAGHMLTLLSQYADKLPGFISKGLMSFFRSVDQGRGSFLSYRRHIHKFGKYYSYSEKNKYGLYTIVGDLGNASSVFSGNREKTLQFIANYFPKGENIYDSMTSFEADNFLIKNLNYVDKISMANSVECRVPFLDHRIVEFAFSIPREYKLSNTFQAKRIIKDTFKKNLPDYILKRKKAGFGMPLRSIFSNADKTNQLLDKTFFSNFNGFSVPAIERSITDHVSGREDNSALIYALVSFQEWYKMNFK